jgi:protein-disulfide isomerase
MAAPCALRSLLLGPRAMNRLASCLRRAHGVFQLLGILLWPAFTGCDEVARTRSTANEQTPVVAVYGKRSIRLNEVDALIADQLVSLRSQALKSLVFRELAADAAKARNISVEELYHEADDGKFVEPDPNELAELFSRAVAKGTVEPDTDYSEFVQRLSQVRQRRQSLDRMNALYDRLAAARNLKIDQDVLGQTYVKISSSGPSRGSEDAPITIVEYSDFTSPHCGMGHRNLEQVLSRYDGKVRLEFRAKPDAQNPQAQTAAEAGLCADEQQRYWEYRSLLFTHQDALAVSDLKKYAQELHLDQARFDSCLDSGRQAKRVTAHVDEASKLGLDGNPFYLVNGMPFSGAISVHEFQRTIDSMLAGRYLGS